MENTMQTRVGNADSLSKTQGHGALAYLVDIWRGYQLPDKQGVFPELLCMVYCWLPKAPTMDKENIDIVIHLLKKYSSEESFARFCRLPMQDWTPQLNDQFIEAMEILINEGYPPRFALYNIMDACGCSTSLDYGSILAGFPVRQYNLVRRFPNYYAKLIAKYQNRVAYSNLNVTMEE